MTKDALESAIKAANLWSGRSTLVLAGGILGEYALLPFVEKKRWYRTAKIFFAVFVVAGIVGEYEFSSLIAQHADELQRLSDQALSDAATQAGAAVERAEKLDTSNKQLGISIEIEKQKTAELQTTVADARERQAEAEQTIARLRLDQAPRTTIDLRKFVEVLSKRPKWVAEILYQSEDTEAAAFSSILERGLYLAGWRLQHPPEAIPRTFPGLWSPITIIGAQPTGVSIFAQSISGPNDSAYKALCDAFSEIQFPVFSGPKPDLDDRILIIVGPKP